MRAVGGKRAGRGLGLGRAVGLLATVAGGRGCLAAGCKLLVGGRHNSWAPIRVLGLKLLLLLLVLVWMLVRVRLVLLVLGEL